MDPADIEAVCRAISHQQAQLGQHDQALQEITSSLRELSLTITSRLPVTPEPPAPVPSHSASPREPFIPAPERYEGDLGLWRAFLLQCSLLFELQPQTYPTDKAWIAYLSGALRGEALAWATVVWERGSAACFDYSVISEEMRRVFNHPVRGREASQRLLLRQGSRSVASFAVEFRTLAVESGWNEDALQGVFLNVLGSDVKDELTSREESSDLEHLIALAIRVDNRLRERRRERALCSSSTPSSMPPAASRPPLSVSFPPRHERRPLSESEPMQIGRTHLSSEERERRILSRVFLSGCPSRPGKRAASPVTRGILASRALDPSVSRPLLCATLLWQDQAFPLTILLDSGADESFINREVVHQLGIDTVPLDSPIETQALDGRTLARVERRSVPVNLLVSGNHHESISLLVISSPLSPVVLGYPWLKTNNPQIDWVTGRVIYWSTHCLSHCLRSAQSPRASELGSATAPPDLSSVPEEYHDLGVVFSKSHALGVQHGGELSTHVYGCSRKLTANPTVNILNTHK